jgi:ABC-type Fe3+-hydroxamate transport system substrate-binding protein
MRTYGERDDLGGEVRLGRPVRRIVSLVPSLTEAVAATAPELLVGATAWCSHPADLEVERIGGTKNPDTARIAALRPDLVIANEEENRAADLDALREAGVPVWVTRVRTVDEAFDSLGRLLTEACGLDQPSWLERARTAWSSVQGAPRRRRALVPIWRRPWMVLGRDTFAGDVLARLGVANVYAGHAERYPRIALPDLLAADPDLVVLPDEPYAFSPDDGPEAFPGRPVALVSGRHLTWYGPSLERAPEVLAGRLAGEAGRGDPRTA